MAYRDDICNFADDQERSSREFRGKMEAAGLQDVTHDPNGPPIIHLFNLDWLEIMFETDLAFGHDLYEWGRFRLVRTSENPVWRHAYAIEYDGLPWGTLQTTPKNTHVLSMDNVLLKLNNDILYTEFIDSVLQFEKEIGRFKHVTEFHLAGDGYNLLKPLNEWMQGAVHRVNAGNQETPTVKFEWKGGKPYYKYFKFGTHRSKKAMRCYNKAKEIESSHKNYILNYWKANGIKDTDTMERIELVFKVEMAKLLFEKDYICEKDLNRVLTWMLDIQFQVEVFKTHLKSLYSFRNMDNAIISRCTPVHAIQYVTIPKGLWRPVKLLSTVVKKVSDGVYGTKMLLKSGIQWAYKTNNPVLFAVVNEIARNTYLESYVEERKPRWRYEVQHKYKKGLPFLDFIQVRRRGKPLKLVKQLADLTKPIDALSRIRDMKAHLSMMELTIQPNG